MSWIAALLVASTATAYRAAVLAGGLRRKIRHRDPACLVPGSTGPAIP